MAVRLGDRFIGSGHPTYIIAELGVNHNGSLDLAKRLILAAAEAGCDAVKFQKRTPELCVPADQWHIERDTPWGRLTYIEYRKRVEFGHAEYREIARYCSELKLEWFASCWDEAAVDFIEQFSPPLYKAASASLTNLPLLLKMKSTGKPLILSTGMSTMEEIVTGVETVGQSNLLIAHSTSAYPCKVEELNLRVIKALQRQFPSVPIGYSGHETGLVPTCAAVVLGACFIERHITLDRALWGTDQAASVEIGGLRRLVVYIRETEDSMGDGRKRVYESELAAKARLRRVVASGV